MEMILQKKKTSHCVSSSDFVRSEVNFTAIHTTELINQIVIARCFRECILPTYARNKRTAGGMDWCRRCCQLARLCKTWRFTDDEPIVAGWTVRGKSTRIC